MPEVTARGVRFHVQTLEPQALEPPHPVVVFVHGLVTDGLSSFYGTLARPVAAAGARAVLYDQRGHGRSERPPTGYSAANAVADLFAVLDALGHRRPVYVVANGFGGFIALNAALARPERIAGLVLIESYGPAVNGGDWSENMLNTLGRAALALDHDRLADRHLAVGGRRGARQAATADALLNGTSLLEDLAAAEPLRPADLSAVTCPVLAVHAEHSDVAEVGRLLLRSVPDCTLHVTKSHVTKSHVMPGHSHSVSREGTRELLEVMLPWLAYRAGTTVPAAVSSVARGGAL
jgi:pimeloyl-ACP methyl ester carboxylesterase